VRPIASGLCRRTKLNILLSFVRSVGIRLPASDTTGKSNEMRCGALSNLRTLHPR
jgi:hypothetical protein